MPKKDQVPAKPEDSMPEKRKDPPFTLRPGAANYHALAATQCIRSAPWSYMQDDEPKTGDFLCLVFHRGHSLTDPPTGHIIAKEERRR